MEPCDCFMNPDPEAILAEVGPEKNVEKTFASIGIQVKSGDLAEIVHHFLILLELISNCVQ